MNIYDVLRKLVEARPWTDQDRADALRLLDDLERMSVLGTMAGSTTEQNHHCEPGGTWFPESVACRVCGKPLTPPEHACVPKEFESQRFGGWGTIQTITKCAICGRNME